MSEDIETGARSQPAERSTAGADDDAEPLSSRSAVASGAPTALRGVAIPGGGARPPHRGFRIGPLSVRSFLFQPDKAPLQWIFEGMLIVVSVLLAFALDEFREARADRHVASRVLAAIHAEMTHNLATLEPFVPLHAAWMQALAASDGSGKDETALDVWFATRPSLRSTRNVPFPVLRRSAWEAAVSGGTLRLIDYDLATALADVYGAQELASGNVQRLATGPLSTTAVYDSASRASAVRMLWLTLADIHAAEDSLLSLYQRHLPTIRAASKP